MWITFRQSVLYRLLYVSQWIYPPRKDINIYIFSHRHTLKWLSRSLDLFYMWSSKTRFGRTHFPHQSGQADSAYFTLVLDSVSAGVGICLRDCFCICVCNVHVYNPCRQAESTQSEWKCRIRMRSLEIRMGGWTWVILEIVAKLKAIVFVGWYFL